MEKLYGKYEAAEILKCRPETVLKKLQLLYKNSDGNIQYLRCGYVLNSIGLSMLRAAIKPVGKPRKNRATYDILMQLKK
jgi:hypothetical protein